MYVSHRVLRWSISAFALPLLFVLNGLLLTQGNLYIALFVAQALFYAFAWVGYLNQQNPNQQKVFFVPYYLEFSSNRVVGILARAVRKILYI